MVPFFVQIKCQLGKSYEVANRLADAEIASEIYSTAGDFDLLVKFYVEQSTDIGHFIAQKVQTIDGVQDTRTIITFKAFGGSSSVVIRHPEAAAKRPSKDAARERRRPSPLRGSAARGRAHLEGDGKAIVFFFLLRRPLRALPRRQRWRCRSPSPARSSALSDDGIADHLGHRRRRHNRRPDSCRRRESSAISFSRPGDIVRRPNAAIRPA